MITQVFRKVSIFFAWIAIMFLPAFALADVEGYTLVADYVPVVNTDSTGVTAGEVGLYDFVSGTLNLSATATPFNETMADPADTTAIPNASVTFEGVVASPYTYTYNGTEQTPSVTVKMGETILEKGTDYDLIGASAKDVGLYTLSVVGKGTYTGTKDIPWEIVPVSVTATAKSYTVNLGTTAPTYEVEYEGFANGETASVLTTVPALACAYDAATAQEGNSFPISFSIEPVAKNYTFVCVSGTITVSSVYTITLNAGNGTGGSLSQYTYAYSPNEDILVTVNKPNSPEGRHVNGNSWETTTNGVPTGTPRWTTYDKNRTPQHQLKIPAGARGDIVVTPSYGKNSVTFSYNKNLPAAWGVIADSIGYYLDQSVVTIKNCTYSAPGYRFLGWNNKSGGAGTSFVAGDEVNVYEREYGKDTSQTITLYAQWEQTHSDLFYENLFDVKEFSKSTSGSFRAWNTSSGKDRGTIAIDLSNNGIILSNDTNEVHIAYGMDTKYFRVQLEKDQSYTLNFKVEYLSKPAGADPDERADWTGQIYLWGVVNSGNQSYSSNNASLEKQTDGSYQLTFTPSELISNMSKCSLQLRFAVNTKGVAIKFHDIKLSKASPDPAVLTNWGAMLPIGQPLGDALVTPERAGYVFQGWKDAAGNDVTAETVMPASSLTVFSQWKQCVYVTGLVAESRPYAYENMSAVIDATNAKYVDADDNELTDLTTPFPTSGEFTQSNVKGGIGNDPQPIVVNYDFALNETDAAKYELVKPELSAIITRAEIVASVKDVNITYDGSYHYLGEGEGDITVTSEAPSGISTFYYNVEDGTYNQWPGDNYKNVDEYESYLILTDGDPSRGGQCYNNLTLTGTVTITPAPLTAQATVNGVSDGTVQIYYGDPIPTLGVAYTGFVADETPDTAYNFTPPTVTTIYEPGSPAGTYMVTVTGGSAGDYAITRQSTTFEVVEPTYTITMNAGEDGVGGGTVEGGYQFNANDAQSFVLPTPTRTGYHISESQTQVNVDGVTFKYHAASEGQGLYYTVEIPAGTRGNIEITPVWDANTYTIKYEGNPLTKKLRGFITTSGSVSDQSCYYDRDVTLRANGFTRAGYTFAGWNTEKNGSGTSYEAGATTRNLTKKNNSTVTLYAQWTRTGYELGYDNYFSLADFASFGESLKLANDSDMTNGTISADLSVGSLTIARKETTAEVRTPYMNSASYYTMQLKPSTSYRVTFNVGSDDESISWKLTAYTIDESGYGKGMSKPSTQKGEREITFATTASGKAQLIFWNSRNNSSVTFSNIRVVEAARAEQAAKSESVRKLVTAGEAVGELEEPTWLGHKFLGWYTSEDYSNPFDETSTITASTPLFSKWETETYQLTLDRNGGEGGNLVTYDQLDTPITTYQISEQEQVFYLYPTPIRLGRYIAASDCSVTGPEGANKTWFQYVHYDDDPAHRYFLTIPANTTGDITLTLTWYRNSYTVKYNKNCDDATGNIQSVTAKYEDDVTIAEPFTRPGYAFLGWNTMADGSGDTYQPYDVVKNLTTIKDSVVNLYAQWAQRTAVCYATVNGSTNDTTTIALGAACPTLGYMYVGSVEGEDPAEFETVAPTVACDYTTLSPVGIYTVTLSGAALDDYEVTYQPTSFEVIYGETKYSIKLEGQKVDSYTAKDTNQAFDLSSYVPTREGYEIAGWNIEGGNLTKGGAVTFDSGSLAVPAGCYGEIDVSAAGWTQSSPIVVFHLNDGSDTTAEQAFTAGESAALKTLANLGFSRKNYRFKGWSKTGETGKFELADGAETTPFAAGAAIDARVDYHAIWEKIPLAFFFDANGGKALTDNARVIPQGDPMTHNANIMPSNPGYVKSNYNHLSADSLTNGVVTLVLNNTTKGYSYLDYKLADCVPKNQDGVTKYSGILEVLYVNPEKNTLSVFKFAESNSGANNTQIAGTAPQGKTAGIDGSERILPDYWGDDTKTVTTGVYFANDLYSRKPSEYTTASYMMRNDVGFGNIDMKYRQSIYAGRAPEVAAAATADFVYQPSFEGYIVCALPTPTWTGMRFVEWNTAADGSGRAVTAESLADGQLVGQEGSITTLYAIWEPDGAYVWNKSSGGSWDPSAAGESDNWYATTLGYMGYPNAVDADVYFLNVPLYGFSSAGGPITVTSAADVTMGSLTFGANTQPVTLNMGGHTLVATTDGVTTNAELSISGAVTFSNGDYSFGPARLPGASSDVIVDEGANLTIHTHANNHYAWGRSDDNVGDQKLTIREGATLRFVNDDREKALNESHCYGLTTIDGGTFDIDSPKGSKLFFDGGLIADQAKIVLPEGSGESYSIRFNSKSAVPYQVNNSDIDAAYVYVETVAKTVGLTNSVLHKGSKNLTYLYVTASDSNIFAENTDLSILRIRENKSNINVEATQGSSIRIYVESGAFENTIYAVDSEVQRLWLSTNELGKVLSHDNSFVFSNCTLVAENSFWVRGTNNIVRIEGSTEGQTINFKLTEKAKLVFSLPEDAAEREAPIYVKKSSGNLMDVTETIVIEKGDYVIEPGVHKYLPLIRLDNSDDSSLLETFSDDAQIATLADNAEVDEAFGTLGTNWRFVVVGRTLCLELYPPAESAQIYNLSFGEIEGVSEPGTLSQTTYAHNYAVQTVTITPPTFVESTDQITGWTIENDLDETLTVGFSEQPKVGSKNSDGTYTLTIPARMAGNLTITPIVTSKKCVFTFSANCTTYTGTMAKQTLKYNEGNRLTPNAFARLGYAFAGWNTVKGGTGIQFSDNQEITSIEGDPSKLTLYAQWRPTAFGLGYENLFILSDFVKSDGPFRAYSTSAENSSQGTISADLTAGSLTLENKVDSTSDEVHTTRATKKSQMPDYYLMPITYQYYTVRFSVTGAEANASVEGAQFAVDAMVGTSGLGTRLDVGAVTNSVDGTYSFNLRAKSSASVWLQIRFFTFGKGASYTFSDIRVYPTAKEEIVRSLSDAATAWGQTFFPDTATAYVTPLPTPTRAGFTFVGWNTEPDGSGVWSDDAAFVPDATSHILYSQWTVAKPTVTSETFVYDRLSHTGVMGMPDATVATVTDASAINAGTYTAVVTLVDPSVAWDDGSAHGSKDNVELVWSIASKPLSIGKTNDTYNDEGFNRPNQWGLNVLYDGRNVTVKPSAYKYKGAADAGITLVEGTDYTVTFYDMTNKVEITSPTYNMPIRAGYKTILTGIGNFTGTVEATWSVSRPIYIWQGESGDMWAKNGNWRINDDNINNFNNKWPNSRNQSAKMVQASVIDLTNDDKVYCYQFYTDGSFTGTIKNGTLYHYDTVRALGGSTLVFENMTIQGNSGTGCRVYPANADSSLMFVGNNSLTGAANLQYGTTVSNSTLAFVNGYTEALPTAGDKNIICKSATNEYTLVRNFVMTNAMLKAIAMDPGSEDDMKTKKVEFNFQFTLGELNMPNGKPMAEFTDKLRIPSGSTMSIDCSGMDAGEYPIMKAAKFFDNANIVEHTEINGVAFGLVATVVKKGSFGDKGGEIVLQLAHAYRALGNEEDTPAIGIPDSWITDFGRTPSSEHAVAEETMRLLNIPNEHGITPVQGFLMGFTAKETETIQPLAISKPTNGAITLSLCNSAAPTKPWPETPERSDAQVRYILETAAVPDATEWTPESEKEEPDFTITDLESSSHVKYYRIRLHYKVSAEPLKQE